MYKVRICYSLANVHACFLMFFVIVAIYNGFPLRVSYHLPLEKNDIFVFIESAVQFSVNIFKKIVILKVKYS